MSLDLHAECVRFVRATVGNPHDPSYLAQLARFYAVEFGLKRAEKVFADAGYHFEIDPFRWMRG